jgi:hypothetical protein
VVVIGMRYASNAKQIKMLGDTARVVIPKHLKTILERMGFAASLTLLAAYFALIGSAFFLAARDKMIPTTWWDFGGGNHGPWRHYQPVRSLLSYALMVLLGAMVIGGFTGAFLGRTRAGFVMVISLVLLVLDLAFLFWLTD